MSLKIFDQAGIGTEDALGHASFLGGLVDDASLDLVENLLDVSRTAAEGRAFDTIQLQLK